MYQASHNRQDVTNIKWQELIEIENQRNETQPTNFNCQVVYTGEFTGRSPKDRFIVAESSVIDTIDWNTMNQPISENSFWVLFHKVSEHLNKVQTFETNVFAGAIKSHRFPVKFITEKVWQSHFCRNMFVESDDVDEFNEQFTIYNASSYFEKNWENYGLNSPTFVIFNIKEKIGIIAGTEYGGEMKKGIFSMLNYLYPMQGILTMHCGAKVHNNSTSLFFGLSGTGKTSLSTTEESLLIGDDEHAWTAGGVFNLEGGCYAKTAHLDAIKEPVIFNAIHSDALIENVPIHENKIDFEDLTITPNGRVSYPLNHIPNLWDQKLMAPHPKRIFLLTCDTLGVIPPVSILNHEQAAFQFLSGYTAKVSGTELGVTNPELVFSSCYGAPFMTLSPLEYTRLLYKKIRQHDVQCFLINTGWVNGSYGKGNRISIDYSRKIIHWCENEFNSEVITCESTLGLRIPIKISGIPMKVLNPRKSWNNSEEFDQQVQLLKDAYSLANKKYLEELDEFNLGLLKHFFW